jgi:hypothetical protein
MNHQIDSLYPRIGQVVFDHRPASNWSVAHYTFKAIALMYEERGYFETTSEDKKYFLTKGKLTDLFVTLRTEMAKLHENGHAWYTATFTLTPDGKFKMDFDYDHLPTFDIMPDPSDWLDEFKKYPRPELQAQIQDWIDGRINFKTDHAQIIERLRSLAKK